MLGWQGIVIGLSVAAPVGPMAVLCLRRSIMFGRSVGLATGIGAASVHAIYSAVGMLGVKSVSTLLADNAALIQIVGGLVVIGLGVRIAVASPPNQSGELQPLRPRSAYASAFGLCMGNPLTLVSLASQLAALDLRAAQGAPTAIALVLGVFVGSSLWWLVMSGSATVLAARLKARTIGALNRLAGPCMVVVGASIAWG